MTSLWLLAQPRQQGLLVMAHGGTPEWNQAVREAVEPLKQWCPVELAFGMADRESLQVAVSRLEDQGVNEIAVVRLLVSGESFLEQTEYFLGLRPQPPAFFLIHPKGKHGGHAEGSNSADRPRMQPRLVDSQEHPIPPIQTSAQLVISREGLYDSPAMGRVIEQRVAALSRRPEQEAVLILAHGEGSDDVNARWLAQLDALAHHIRDAGFAAVQVETLREDWRDKRRRAENRIRNFVTAQHALGRDVVVVPFRVFGFGPYRKVLEGLDYRADGRGLLPHPAVTDWIREQASKCFDRAGFSNPLTPASPE